ncbi:MAG: oligosaccharide flippase family protein [Burkholderiaceae bacterium]|jgi:O-antigen/teichoic acid export membrane protein|nr:oligosaccharide flippase family protein [Burkholderiaceae bacterium]
MLRATLILLSGGALAQVLPLLLGPAITRLFSPQAMGVFTAFSTVAATVAVVACARYEYALPLVRSPAQAAALLALCLRIWLAVALLSVALALALHALWRWPLAWMLPLAVASSGLLQLLMMWSNRAGRFKALAVSRVIQYGGAALLQLLFGWLLWTGTPAAHDGAWLLAAGAVLAALLALAPLLRPAPVGGWRALWPPAGGNAALPAAMRQQARAHRDFPLLNTPHAFLGTLQDALAVALLMACSGEAAAGFWGLALRYLKAPATLVGTAVSQALYPRLTQSDARAARRAVRQVMAVLGVLGLALGLALYLAAPSLFAWVFGERWRAAGELAGALSPYIATHFVAAPLAVVTMAWRAQRWAFRLALAGQVVFLAALAWGLLGDGGSLLRGAWAVSAGMTLYFGYYFWRLAFWPLPAGQAGAAAASAKDNGPP